MLLKKDRIFYLDEIRALAILLVLLAHTIQNFPVQVDYLTSPTLLSYLTISRMGVPLFFMLSGALLIGKDYTLSGFFKKRFTRVLIPAVFWYIILFLSVASANWFNFDLMYIWINDAPFYWFVCAIIGVYLVIPIFSSFVKEYGTGGAGYFILIWLILVVLVNYNVADTYYPKLIFNNVGLYIGFAVLGYYLANVDIKVYSLPMAIFSTIVFIACVAFNMYYAYYFTVVVYIQSVSIILQCSALFLILRYLSKYAKLNPSKTLSKCHKFIENSFIGTLIYSLSVCSYTIYLMHGHIVNLLLQYYPIRTFDLVPVVFILLAVISLAVAVILSKIPVLNKLIGVN